MKNIEVDPTARQREETQIVFKVSLKIGESSGGSLAVEVFACFASQISPLTIVSMAAYVVFALPTTERQRTAWSAPAHRLPQLLELGLSGSWPMQEKPETKRWTSWSSCLIAITGDKPIYYQFINFIHIYRTYNPKPKTHFSNQFVISHLKGTQSCWLTYNIFSRINWRAKLVNTQSWSAG